MLPLDGVAFALLAQLVVPPAARPPECAALEGGRGLNVWERAKDPELGRYCDALASGAAKLAAGGAMAAEVMPIADEAERLRPGHGAPLVLKARALFHVAQYEDARGLFLEAQRRDGRALDDPAALLAWARVSAQTGHVDDARVAYRAVLPRDGTLPVPERGAACVEAGLLAMDAGAAGLDEAIALLRQGQRDAQDQVRLVSGWALSLALDRAGERDEAAAVLAELPVTDVRAAMTSVQRRGVFAPKVRVEAGAIAATALGMASDAAARQAWRAYLDDGGAKGPWAAHARLRAAAIPSRRAP